MRYDSSDRAETYIVRIEGSSTVFPITEAIAEEIQEATKIRTTVGISGNGGGFKKFCLGETEMTQAFRPILIEEMEACKAAGIEYIELPIAYDALTVVINLAYPLYIGECNSTETPEVKDFVDYYIANSRVRIGGAFLC